MEIEFDNYNGYYIQPEQKVKIQHVRDVLLGKGNIPPFISLVGPLGSGKRTLAEALAHEYMQLKEKKQKTKMNTHEVVELFIHALREGTEKVKEFNEMMLSADILIITDLEEIFNKEQTYEKLYYLFEKRVEEKKPVILTANTDDSAIDAKLQRFFKKGLLFHFNLPGFYMRRKLVIESMKRMGYEASDRIITYIADYVISDMNLIDTIVRNSVINVLKDDKELDLTHVQYVMKDFISIKGQWV